MSHIDLLNIIASMQNIALVGASQNEARPAWQVMRYLVENNFTLYPVNPGLAGQMLLGCKVYASLADIPAPLDVVDVFRNSEAVPALVAEIASLSPRPHTLWLQLGINHPAAEQAAQKLGLNVVTNRCLKIEHMKQAFSATHKG